MKRFHCLATLVVAATLITSASAAVGIKVDCNQGQTINGVLTTLAQKASNGHVTLYIYGTCNENVLIGYLDRITLVGQNGATIQDPSGGANSTVSIYDSTFIDLQNLTINGGADGVDCVEMSTCRMENNVVQNAAGEGVHVARSSAILLNNTLQNHGFRGLSVINGASVLSFQNMVTGNLVGVGVVGANYTAQKDTIQNNGGSGIRAINNSTLRIMDLTISGNGASGIRLDSASTLTFLDSVGTNITANAGNGVLMMDQTNVAFSGLDNVGGNTSQPDVACNGQYDVATGAHAVGGTTNCP